MKKIGRYGTVAVLLSISGLLVSCASSADPGEVPSPSPTDEGDDLSQLIADAKAEGQVVLYASRSEVSLQRVAEGFQSTYGIPVNYTRLDGPVFATRFEAEQTAGTPTGDVLLTSEQSIFSDFTDKGWLATLDPAEIPSLGAYPEPPAEDGTSIIVSIGPFGNAINTDLVDTKFDDWEGLLDSSFKGRLATGPVDGISALSTWNVIYEDLGEDFFTDFAAQDPIYTPSLAPAAEGLASGEYSVLALVPQVTVQGLIDQGAPIEWLAACPTSGVEARIGINSTAQHPAGARLLSHYLLTAEGQEALNGNGLGASLIPDVPTTLDLPSCYEAPDQAEALSRLDMFLDLLGTTASY